MFDKELDRSLIVVTSNANAGKDIEWSFGGHFAPCKPIRWGFKGVLNIKIMKHRAENLFRRI